MNIMNSPGSEPAHRGRGYIAKGPAERVARQFYAGALPSDEDRPLHMLNSRPNEDLDDSEDSSVDTSFPVSVFARSMMACVTLALGACSNNGMPLLRASTIA